MEVLEGEPEGKLLSRSCPSGTSSEFSANRPEARGPRVNGTSMLPTLRPGDGLELVQCAVEDIRPGDVIVLNRPGSGDLIAHRVVSCDADGFVTRGDNSPFADEDVARPEDVLGRVDYAIRGKNRRRIYGGAIGRILADIMHARRAVLLTLKQRLRKPYRSLADHGVLRDALSRFIRSRVYLFSRPDGIEFQLIVFGRSVAVRKPRDTRWMIKPPFRLLVDERELDRICGSEGGIEFRKAGRT